MTSAGLCDWCVRRLRHELIELEEIYVGLSTERRRTLSGRVSGTREAPAPVDITRLSWLSRGCPSDGVDQQYPDDQDGVVPLPDTLSSWARLIAEERGLTGHISNPFLLLLRHLDWAATKPWADDYAEEIHGQLRTGRALAGTGRVVHNLKSPCPACGVRALLRQEGSDWVDCAACDGGWDSARWPLGEAS